MLTEADILKLGFRRLTEPGVIMSKLVNTNRVPPFYIRLDKAEHNDTDWRVLRGREFVTIVDSVEKLKLAIRVLTIFERDTFAEG